MPPYDTPTARPVRTAVLAPLRRSAAVLAGTCTLVALALPTSTTTAVLVSEAQAAPPAVARTAAVAPSAAPVSSQADVGATARARKAPLRIASYNVRNASTFTHRKNERPWVDRRGAVVAAIRGQHLDVLGVQEASQGMLKDAASKRAGLNQYEDLVRRLGGSWRVTNPHHYNCERSASPNRCTYRYRGASGGTRILYDAARVDLLAQGSAKLPVPKGKPDSFVAWAELRQRSTGKRFLVADLHTVGTDAQHAFRTRQAKVALATLRAHNPRKRPMIALGDWNSSRFEKPSNGPYDVFVRAGFVDPLGGRYRTTKPKGATVEHRVRTWVNSSNPTWSRKAPGHKAWVNGSYIDYVLTTRMRVSEWETVARLDAKGRFKGVIPSDHNMIRATVWLP